MKKTVWFLLDNRMGSVGQAKGIMQALDPEKYEIIEKKIEYNSLSGLPNLIRGKSLIGISKASKEGLKAPYPDLVVSISRRTVPIARHIKQASKGKTKAIQLMHPGNIGINDFELIFVPEHDRHKKQCKNIVYLTGCPHRVTEKALAEGAEKWAETFKDLPRPLTAVMIGGAIKGKPFALENAQKLGQEIKDLKQKIGGSLLITNSKRTGEEASRIIMDSIKEIPAYTYLWGEKKENPIMGFWALADNIVVTGDSVSMPCECCGSGKPVYIFTGKDWLTSKHERFVKSLVDGEYAALFGKDGFLDFQPKQRLNPSTEVAAEINKLFE